ncbi:hypothetical protein ACQKPX_05370 [Photobacterium sp. DNB23_23_1]
MFEIKTLVDSGISIVDSTFLASICTFDEYENVSLIMLLTSWRSYVMIFHRLIDEVNIEIVNEIISTLHSLGIGFNLSIYNQRNFLCIYRHNCDALQTSIAIGYALINDDITMVQLLKNNNFCLQDTVS